LELAFLATQVTADRSSRRSAGSYRSPAQVGTLPLHHHFEPEHVSFHSYRLNIVFETDVEHAFTAAFKETPFRAAEGWRLAELKLHILKVG
jgi:hypothetical protein